MTVAAVIVAAGAGLRAGGERPKQYQLIAGKPVIWWALKAFCDHPQISFVQPVIGENHHSLFDGAAAGLAVEPAVAGGSTRQDSCRIGIETLSIRSPDRVLIHDAARPFVSTELIEAADRMMRTRDYAELGDIRVGQGVDIHAFAPGDHVVLCGVRISHTRRLAGHSDADAPLHALTDAILGALGEGDIGTHFPPTD